MRGILESSAATIPSDPFVMSLSHFRFVLPSLAVALVASAQTVPPGSDPVSLDAVIVTGNPDARAAFDLAQGASLLSGQKLMLSQQGTLGETLAATPGVNSTYYGPGASRPVIRGLGGDRVRMLDNGVGSLDASNVSPDHNVSVEPLLVERIEVLRGPASLLYGSSAVGGVVNVIDNRIPVHAADTPFSGRLEARYGSAAHERTGIVALTTGNDRFAMQINGLRTETDDVEIPGYADAADPAHYGTLSNSAVSTKSASVGGSGFWSGGQFGAAVSEYDTTYGVPVGEPINIDMKQRRADFRGSIDRPFAIFKSATARFGIADYTHAEVDTETGNANTTFTNKAYEGRVELVQQEVGDLTGTIGTQFSRSDFSAVGEEVVTPPSITSTAALFVLESYKVSPVLTLQAGGRLEQQTIKVGDVDASLPPYPGYDVTSGEKRTEDAFSVSAGAVIYPVPDYSIGLSLALSRRNPTAQELFSNGPHGGTGSYEIGTSDLGQEKSLGLDLTARKRAGVVTGSIGVFVNRFNDFIFEQEDATTYFDDGNGTFAAYPAPDDAEILPIYQFVARDALFYGGEAELSFHLVDHETRRLHLDLTGDYVRAEQTSDDQDLPRIPPVRVGAELHYTQGPWDFSVGARHAFDQDHTAPGESSTDGYTLCSADVTYEFMLDRTHWQLFARGTNLSDEDARVSTSFLKDVAPLPGRNVNLGVRLSF